MGDESLLMIATRPAVSADTTPEQVQATQHPTDPRRDPEHVRAQLARDSIMRYMAGLQFPWLRRWLRT